MKHINHSRKRLTRLNSSAAVRELETTGEI